MQHELAHDISAETPMNEPTQALLVSEYHVLSGYLNNRITDHRALIAANLGRLDTAVAMSRPYEMDPVPGFHDDYTPSKNATDFEKEYASVRRNPLAKMELDNELADAYVRSLGPTNPLRRKDGLDAGFELARVRNLLDTDYANLPESMQKPELLMNAAYISEMLALLWSPALLQQSARLPQGHRDFIGTANDRNVLSDSQIESLSPLEKWGMSGAVLCREAADRFEAVSKSESADTLTRLEASVRMTDMRIREAHIRGITAKNNNGVDYAAEIRRLSYENMQVIGEAWQKNSIKTTVKRGQLYELMVLAREREELVTGPNADNYLIRLGLPHEDKIHKKVIPLTDKKGNTVKLSSDIIIEDNNGRFVTGYQVKSLSELEYEEANKQLSGKAIVYPSQMIRMRFNTGRTITNSALSKT